MLYNRSTSPFWISCQVYSWPSCRSIDMQLGTKPKADFFMEEHYSKLIQQIEAGAIAPESLKPQELLIVLSHYYREKNTPKINQLSAVAKARLEKSGLQWCEGIGWCKERDIPYMGIALKDGRWSISDRMKFDNYSAGIR